VALASIVIGAAFTGIEIYGAAAYLLEQAQPPYLVLGGALTTAAAATLIPLSERCFRDGRYLLGVLLMAALIPALSIIVTAAIERTGGARDRIAGDHQAKAAAIRLKNDAVADAKADLERLRAAEERECNSAKPGADPRGPRCKSAEKRTQEGRERLETVRGKLADAGVASKDPMVARLAAVLPGISEADIALFHPLILPLTISLLGILFIAAGARPPKPREAQTRRGKRKKRRRPVPPKPSEGRNVVPLRRKA
jgi:hypothetical protein